MDDFTTAAFILVVPMVILILICIPAGLKVTVHFPEKHEEEKNSDNEYEDDSDDELTPPCYNPLTEPPPIVRKLNFDESPSPVRALNFDDSEDGHWDDMPPLIPVPVSSDESEVSPLSSETS